MISVNYWPFDKESINYIHHDTFLHFTLTFNDNQTLHPKAGGNYMPALSLKLVKLGVMASQCR